MTRTLPVFAVALLFLAGCTSQATTAGYQARLESLNGVHIDEVVMAWGPPDAEFTFEDGRRMYSFVTSRTVAVPSMAMSPGFVMRSRLYGRRYGGYFGMSEVMEMRRYYCETRLITDPGGRVSEWNFRGNACRAVPPEVPDEAL